MHSASLLFILFLSIGSVAAVQLPPQGSAKRTAQQQQEQKAVQEQSVALIKEIISEGRLLRLSDNTAIVLALAADSLDQLADDRKNSRLVFKESVGYIDSAISNDDHNDYALSEYFLQLREDILIIIEKRDRQLARQLSLALQTTTTSIIDPSFQQQENQMTPILPESDTKQMGPAQESQESNSDTQAIPEHDQMLTEKVHSNEDIARQLIREAWQLVRKAKTEKEQLAIIKRLDDARVLIGRPHNSKSLAVLIQVAYVYALLDPARSFEIVEELVNLINDLSAAKVVLAGFSGEEQQSLVRQDELTVSDFLDLLSNKDICALAALLAQADFTRTARLCSTFQRPEIQILSKLLIVRSLQTGQCDVVTP